MEKSESNIDMDVLNAITDRVLSYRPPKSKAKRPSSDVSPSPPDKKSKGRIGGFLKEESAWAG
ncbi:MAG: hypothetical protein F4Y42_21550 [Caldilineaceae bacterium SB0664_bin_27]|uniref:Uncharacterized protein n=1 Tax=Caldilineaceae bacterium SB0664_bin_27 TaxID=2605260 RepID=A0A6B0Z0Q1_9CHLR|nr:hypothetical protein [Caldilineaceae bacterium SB0664_bin_27]